MINALLLDDEEPALKELQFLISKYSFIHVCGAFTNPIKALAAVDLYKPDVVFLDIDMPMINGMRLALQIQSIHTKTHIIFVTAYQEYSIQALEIHALDYLLKPVASQRFDSVVQRLAERINRNEQQAYPADALRIRCFSTFELTKNGIHKLEWRTQKVKELFAYLLCGHGKPLSEYDITLDVFPNHEPKKALNNLYVSMYYLRKQLDAFGVPREMLSIANDYALAVEGGVCDYADFVALSAMPGITEGNIQDVERRIGLYTGHFLGNENFKWATVVREHLATVFEEAVLSAARYHQARMEYNEACALITKLKTIINPV